MPKRKQTESTEGKDASKVTKQEAFRRSDRLKLLPPKAEAKIKKAIVKKVIDEKVAKAKKPTKGKKDDSPAHNGETKTNEETEAAEEANEEKA